MNPSQMCSKISIQNGGRGCVIAALLLVLALAATPSAHAVTVAKCDDASLRAAVLAGGTVNFSCSGTIKLTSPLIIPPLTTINGSGQFVTISGDKSVQVMVIQSCTPGAASCTVTLENLIIADGYNPSGPGGGVSNAGYLTVSKVAFTGNSALSGGAIDNQNEINSISGSLFIGNSAQQGGAIYNPASIQAITGTTFAGNSAKGSSSVAGQGGAIYNSGGISSISGSSFPGNTSQVGGAMYNSGSISAITDTTFTGNSATGGSAVAGQGGAIYSSAVISSISGCSFNSNTSKGLGGAVYNSNAIETITGTTFTGNSVTGGSAQGGAIYNQSYIGSISGFFSYNTSEGQGGAISNSSSGSATISTTTFSHNRSLLGGGGAISDSGGVTVNASTFAYNTTTGAGGAIAVSSAGNNVLTNCTLADNESSSMGGALYNAGVTVATFATFSANTAHAGGDIYNSYILLLYGTIVAGSDSAFGGGNCANIGSGALLMGNYDLDSGSSCNSTSLTNSLFNKDPHLDALKDNGGPTHTEALAAHSPALDAIPPTATGLCGPGASVTTDQRGDPRNNQGKGCDIGAYELQP